MEHDFWHRRWKKKETGFHQGQANLRLKTYWPRLELPAGTQVLVPLCGKSLDMVWLHEQGFAVTGVELSEMAVEAFFAEQQLTPTVDTQGELARYSAEAYEIFCGDLFALPPAAVSGIGAIYDRASLIAFPLEMRPSYVQHLARLCPANTRGLLISIEYPEEQMDGPPFSVREAEVESLFADDFSLEHQADFFSDGDLGHLGERGLKELTEKVYRLSRRS